MARRPGASPRDRSASGNAAAPDADLVLLGEFGRPHGLNGEVRLKSHTGDPLAIAGYGTLSTADGRTLSLTHVRPASGAVPDMLIARVEGVRDRDGAQALNRTALYCPRDRLGGVADEDEFYLADLVGLAVLDEAGAALGTIVAVPNFGGGDLLEIRPVAGGASALLPFTKAFVPVIDIAGGRVVAAPPDDLFAPPGKRPAGEPG